MASRPPEYPREPSAFSLHNIMSGPFADNELPIISSRPRRQREWEREGNFDDGYGFAGPSNVGKRGRDKEKDRMRRRAFDAQAPEDDEDDWFGNRDRRRPQKESAPQSHPPPLGPKRQRSGDINGGSSQSRKGKASAPISFNFSQKSPSFKNTGLADRISDDRRRNDRDCHQDPSDSGRRRKSKGKNDKDRHRDRPRNDGTQGGMRGGNEFPAQTSSGSGRKYYGGYGR